MTALLCLAALLGLVYTQRIVLTDQQSGRHQYRAAQAHEAAEAGLEWTLAMLNSSHRIGPECRPVTDPSATSFRERLLRYDPVLKRVQVRSPETALPAAMCLREESGWSCTCGATAEPARPPIPHPAPAVGFAIRIEAGDRPGVFRVSSTGCAEHARACGSVTAAGGGATARVQALVALLSALNGRPAAALTVRGLVDAPESRFTVAEPDPAAPAFAVHAGASVRLDPALIEHPAGVPIPDTIIDRDRFLADPPADRFFLSAFGLTPTAWAGQPGVLRLVCRGDCSPRLTAMASQSAAPLLHVAGDLRLEGPARIGTPEHPVVIVADGAIDLVGAVEIHGVIYGAAAVTWSAATAAGIGVEPSGPSAVAGVQGALLAGADFHATGAPHLVHDARLLSKLQATAGTYVRLHGSWKDF